jgi:hypothetical protein
MNKQKVALITGIIFAIISLLSEMLRPSWSQVWTSFSVGVVLISIILLIRKQTRDLGKNFLKGLFITLLGVAIVGLVGTFVVVALQQLIS